MPGKSPRTAGGVSTISELESDAATAIFDLDPDTLLQRPSKEPNRLEKAWLAAKELVPPLPPFLPPALSRLFVRL